MYATAYIVRDVLRSTFPGVIFSVRSNYIRPFTNGKTFSLRIAWREGPTHLQVSLALRKFCESKLYARYTYYPNLHRHVPLHEEEA